MADKLPLVLSGGDIQQLQSTDNLKVGDFSLPNAIGSNGDIMVVSAGALVYDDGSGCTAVAANTADIATNTADIATNAGDITTINTFLEGGTSGQIPIADGVGYPTWTDYIAVPADPGDPPLGVTGLFLLKWNTTDDEPQWDHLWTIPESGYSAGQYLRYWDTPAAILEWAGNTLTSTYMLYADSNSEITGTAKMTFDGTDFTIATGSDIIVTDNVATELLYAGAAKEVKSTSKLTFDGTDLTVATGSDIILTDNVASEMLYAGAAKEIKSTSKLTFNTIDFTLATGSSLISTDFTAAGLVYADVNKKLQTVTGVTFAGNTITLSAALIALSDEASDALVYLDGSQTLQAVAALTFDGTDLTILTGSSLTIEDLANTYMLYSSNGTVSATAKLTHNGTDFTVATGSDIIITDNTATEMLYAGAAKEVKSTTKMTHDGTDFAIASGSKVVFGSNVVIEPTGTGSFQANSGGNARGQYAVDLQLDRAAATQVASGAHSAIAGGEDNLVSGTHSFAVGKASTIAGNYTEAMGWGHTGSGDAAFCVGYLCTASGNYTVAIGAVSTATAGSAIAMGWYCDATGSFSFARGAYAVASHYGEVAYSSGRFAADGDAQRMSLMMRIQTTDDTATEMFLDGTDDRLTIAEDTSWVFEVSVNGQQTNDDWSMNRYFFRGKIRRLTGGNATIVGTNTTDHDPEDGAWGCTVTADTTNQSLLITVTGAVDENVNWVATIHLTQTAW